MRAMVDSVSQGNELFEENEHRGVTIRSMLVCKASVYQFRMPFQMTGCYYLWGKIVI